VRTRRAYRILAVARSHVPSCAADEREPVVEIVGAGEVAASRRHGCLQRPPLRLQHSSLAGEEGTLARRRGRRRVGRAYVRSTNSDRDGERKACGYDSTPRGIQGGPHCGLLSQVSTPASSVWMGSQAPRPRLHRLHRSAGVMGARERLAMPRVTEGCDASPGPP
jgi:hypothetical protein